jgi:hypothetical protein
MSLSVFSESMIITQNKIKRVTMKMHSHQTHQIATARLRLREQQHVQTAVLTAQLARSLVCWCVTAFTPVC